MRPGRMLPRPPLRHGSGRHPLKYRSTHAYAGMFIVYLNDLYNRHNLTFLLMHIVLKLYILFLTFLR
jgi:hypothetical protein